MTTGRERGEIAEVGSPVLIAGEPVDQARPWRWTTATVATATGLLALFNAHAIGDWFDELTPSAVSEPLRAPVAALMGATDRLGLDAPRARLHAWWGRVRDARFGSEQPGEQGAAAGE